MLKFLNFIPVYTVTAATCDQINIPYNIRTKLLESFLLNALGRSCPNFTSTEQNNLPPKPHSDQSSVKGVCVLPSKRILPLSTVFNDSGLLLKGPSALYPCLPNVCLQITGEKGAQEPMKGLLQKLLTRRHRS